ncbi:MAG: FecR domain-containing protein [Bdellovibrionales bacterium]|nr:FecR domain-containing protein [Bdellovibrionales bacterium]
MRSLAAMLIGLSFVVLSPSFAFAKGHGVFRVVKGDVKVQSAKTGKTKKAKIGQKVFPKDTVISGEKSRAKIIMVDKNVLNISPNSKIEIEAYEYEPSKKKKNVLLNVIYGKVRSKVKQKYDGKGNKFQVKTKSAVAGVRGTDFVTGYDPTSRQSTVVTFEGKVQFGTPGVGGTIQNAVAVNAGQIANQAGNASVGQPRSVPRQQLAAMDNETNADTSSAGGSDERQPSNSPNESNDKGENSDDKGKDGDAKGSDTKSEGGDAKTEGGDNKAEAGDAKADGDNKSSTGEAKAEGNEKGPAKGNAQAGNNGNGGRSGANRAPAASTGGESGGPAGGDSSANGGSTTAENTDGGQKSGPARGGPRRGPASVGPRPRVTVGTPATGAVTAGPATNVGGPSPDVGGTGPDVSRTPAAGLAPPPPPPPVPETPFLPGDSFQPPPVADVIGNVPDVGEICGQICNETIIDGTARLIINIQGN